MNANLTNSSGNVTGTQNMTNILASMGISTIENKPKSNLSKVQKKAIKRMDEAVLT